ncbi:hypothetical protein T265_04646 [Opisthorchis viverrini]|uniref:Ig-like domain-containing protein n=1 Tax=Opisthorchis viverrini TaxID=6198 RepID=A0A075AGC3_OPIVI|nr:hypothetical protein T265_04646 [Opisthorchis viverrini]KER28604.1 hypothetical protein T265_04646 [Opisthorchis viverrini]
MQINSSFQTVPPDIQMANRVIKQSLGMNTVLSCTVFANPPGTVQWYFNQKTRIIASSCDILSNEEKKHCLLYWLLIRWLLISSPSLAIGLQTFRHHTRRHHQRAVGGVLLPCLLEHRPHPNNVLAPIISKLTIFKLNPADFGDYTCSVSNIMGERHGTTSLQIMLQNVRSENIFFTIQGESPEIVVNITYLGSCISSDGSVCSCISSDGSVSDGVRARISKARNMFANLHHLWRQKGISLDLKGRVCQATVRAVLLYGCVTWPLSTDNVSVMSDSIRIIFCILPAENPTVEGQHISATKPVPISFTKASVQKKLGQVKNLAWKQHIRKPAFPAELFIRKCQLKSYRLLDKEAKL